MIIEKGKILCGESIDGCVNYEIDKSLGKKANYTIMYEYWSECKDYWRRQSGDRYELRKAKGNIVINETNSDELIQFKNECDLEGFKKFMIDHIADYCREVNNWTNKSAKGVLFGISCKTIEEVIEKGDMDENLAFAGIKTIEDKVKYISDKIQKAY